MRFRTRNQTRFKFSNLKTFEQPRKRRSRPVSSNSESDVYSRLRLVPVVPLRLAVVCVCGAEFDKTALEIMF